MKKGFSILEVVVVIFIITLGMVGVFSLVAQNASVQYANKNTLIASQLAQEGVELVKNIRDDNWLLGRAWDSGLETSGQYKIDYKSGLTALNAPEEARLYFDADGFYAHVGLEPAIFYRVITITNNEGKITVGCTVEWKEKEGSRRYALSTEMYDWF